MKKKAFVEFSSFWMGGFECADHINRSGKRVNLLEETEHHLRAGEDYQLLHALGIKVVREGICWSYIEKAPYRFDFSSLKNRLDAAEALGIQIIWDLCHFGYPDDLIPTHPLFDERFMALCRAFALFHKNYTREPLLVVPINEISFLSWHSGEVRGTVPFAENSGFDIKYHLCKAAIKGMEVLKQTIAECILILVEPLVKIHPGDQEIPTGELSELNMQQFQAMDIISGSLCPELGGTPQLYDMVGFNYYYNNQWEHLGELLLWPPTTNKLTPLSALLQQAGNRYHKPLILSETGHFGVKRPQWLEEITLECKQAISKGLDLKGICIYPVVDRPDWDDLNFYCNCGIWDLDEHKNRIPHKPTLSSIKRCSELLNKGSSQGLRN